MAGESMDLTHPSLQSEPPWFWRCVYVAELDFVRHTLGGTCGIYASSPDCADSTPVALALGYPDSRGQFSDCGVANVGDARAGKPALNSKIAAGLEDVVETADHTLRTVCFP